MSLTVAIDCVGTLIDFDGKPRPEIVALLQAFRAIGAKVFIWSGAGAEFARRVANDCGFTDLPCVDKDTIAVDLAIDDADENVAPVVILAPCAPLGTPKLKRN